MYTALIKKATTILCVCVAVLKCTKPGMGSGLILHIILLYSEKLSKKFRSFVAIRASFPCKIWGCAVLWRGKSEQYVKVFSVRIVFFINSRKFSTIWYSLLLIIMWQSVVDSY